MGTLFPLIITVTVAHSNLQYLMVHDESPPHGTGLLAVQFADRASIIPTHEAKMSAIHFF
jgi:hypothetical protein